MIAATRTVVMFTTADRGLDSYGSRELVIIGSIGTRWAKRLTMGLAVAA